MLCENAILVVLTVIVGVMVDSALKKPEVRYNNYGKPKGGY